VASASRRTCNAWECRAEPAAVGRTPELTRSNSGVPISRSRAWICLVSAGGKSVADRRPGRWCLRRRQRSNPTSDAATRHHRPPTATRSRPRIPGHQMVNTALITGT
jgi:hypothetical protein